MTGINQLTFCNVRNEGVQELILVLPKKGLNLKLTLRSKILKGNTISARAANGAIYGVEDAMSAPIEIAPGYVFLAPANPIIGTYGIRENGKYATYVSMRPLNSSDLPGIRRGATAVAKIELPTLQTSQLTLKTKDGYYVTGTWSSGNYYKSRSVEDRDGVETVIFT